MNPIILEFDFGVPEVMSKELKESHTLKLQKIMDCLDVSMFAEGFELNSNTPIILWLNRNLTIGVEFEKTDITFLSVYISEKDRYPGSTINFINAGKVFTVLKAKQEEAETQESAA